ncbi:MAG TPA: alpha/beta hydrolase [Chlamydiales bacterium]|nr:alpha/beta hydrolase [Chlamydiales bacterium]
MSAESPNVVVYVRHYLSSEGVDYFERCWFPLVRAIISQQEGFLSIEHEGTEGDCVSLVLRFEDEATFGRWVVYPGHDDLVNALDPFRSRDYWEVKREGGGWQNIESKKTAKPNGLNACEKIFGDFLEFKRKDKAPLAERMIEDLRAGTKNFGQHADSAASVSFTDGEVPARDGSPLSIRIYNDQLPKGSPVLIFYPGCAFVFDLFEVNGAICSRIAQAAGVKVILVQFRLAPENPMPTSLYDSYDAAAYIATHSENFGIDPHKIFLGGWCSGAHSATVVSSLACKHQDFNVYHQILLGGAYDLTSSIHTFDAYEAQDKTVSRKFIEHIANRYYGIPSDDLQNPIFSPYHETDFNGFPSTTILCGEYDALRNDSEGYYQKLADANVPVEKIILAGQTHDTIAMRKVLAEGPDPAETIAKVIQAKLD